MGKKLKLYNLILYIFYFELLIWVPHILLSAVIFKGLNPALLISLCL